MPGGAPLGNKNAANKNKMFEDALRRKFTQDPEQLARIVTMVCTRAEQGDMRAVEFLRDMTDGKPVKRIDMTNELDNALTLIASEELRAAVRARMAPFFRAALSSLGGPGGEGPRGDQRVN